MIISYLYKLRNGIISENVTLHLRLIDMYKYNCRLFSYYNVILDMLLSYCGRQITVITR